MIQAIMNLLLGCHHRRITRPITPVRKASLERGVTYVACLDCGQQFHYDMGAATLERRPSTHKFSQLEPSDLFSAIA
jgi:hypothetical protein